MKIRRNEYGCTAKSYLFSIIMSSIILPILFYVAICSGLILRLGTIFFSGIVMFTMSVWVKCVLDLTKE